MISLAPVIAESSALNAGASEREGCAGHDSAPRPEELAARQFVARPRPRPSAGSPYRFGPIESMLVIPGGKAAFGVVVSKGDFAVFSASP